MKNNPLTKDANVWLGEGQHAIRAIADSLNIPFEELYITFPPLDNDTNMILLNWSAKIRHQGGLSKLEGSCIWDKIPEPKEFRTVIKRSFAFEVLSRIIPEARFIHMAIDAYAVDQSHPLPAMFQTQVINDMQLRIQNQNGTIDFVVQDIVDDVVFKLTEYAKPRLEDWFTVAKKATKNMLKKK